MESLEEAMGATELDPPFVQVLDECYARQDALARVLLDGFERALELLGEARAGTKQRRDIGVARAHREVVWRAPYARARPRAARAPTAPCSAAPGSRLASRGRPRAPRRALPVLDCLNRTPGEWARTHTCAFLTVTERNRQPRRAPHVGLLLSVASQSHSLRGLAPRTQSR